MLLFLQIAYQLLLIPVLLKEQQNSLSINLITEQIDKIDDNLIECYWIEAVF
jgi:hypothetical protein